MNFNYQKARDLMVENQLRPNKIKDPVILDLFKKKPKEVFIPENLESLSYSDMDITLSPNRGYLKNLHIAQLIKHAEIQKKHKVTVVPTIIIFKDGEEIKRWEADLSFKMLATRKELQDYVNELIEDKY